MQYTVQLAEDTPDFWSLSDRQLAGGCMRIAEGWSPECKPLVRAEAIRLFVLWREAVNAECDTREEAERRACVLAALRKRTFQILVRLHLDAAAAPQEA